MKNTYDLPFSKTVEKRWNFSIRLPLKGNSAMIIVSATQPFFIPMSFKKGKKFKGFDTIVTFLWHPLAETIIMAGNSYGWTRNNHYSEIPFPCYMFHPSAPTSLSLSGSFTLRYVTASSSATDFTPTMASSEDPLSITATLLSRLGHGCRSYNQPGMQTALHRVRSRTFIAHLPPLPYRITKRISGFGSPRYLALL